MSTVLPPEYRFNVASARKSLQALADTAPDTPMLLTIARVGENGLEGETELPIMALGAAALLETVTEEQALNASIGQNLYILRITRAEALPAPAREEWPE